MQGDELPDHRARRRASSGSSTATSGRVRGPRVPDRRRPRVPARRLPGHRDRATRSSSTPSACSSSTTSGRSAPRASRCRPRAAVSNYRSVWRYGLHVENLGGTARTLDEADGPVPLEHGRARPQRRRRRRRLAHRAPAPTTAGSRPAARAPSTSTSSPTAATTAPRCARSTGSPARSRCCRATRWATGGAAITPTPRTSTSALMDRFARGGPPVQRRRAGHGLAPGRHRPPPRQRLDRLHLEPRAVPRPAGVPAPRCTSAGSPSAQRAPRRRRARARGRLRRASPSGWASTPPPSCRSTSTPRTRRSSRPTSRSCTTRSRPRASTSGGWTGSRAGVTSIPGLDPLWLLNHFHFLDSGAQRPPPADVLPLRRDRQPPLPGRLLRRHGRHLGVAGLPAVLHGDRVQRRLRLVEPRRRRALLRLKDDELATRWVQLGVFSPIIRLHSSADPLHRQGAVALRRAARSGS